MKFERQRLESEKTLVNYSLEALDTPTPLRISCSGSRLKNKVVLIVFVFADFLKIEPFICLHIRFRFWYQSLG